MQKQLHNYKSRWDMVKQGFVEGAEEAKKIGLMEDYRYWSPVLSHVYQTGVFAGVFAVILTCVVVVLFDFLTRALF